MESLEFTIKIPQATLQVMIDHILRLSREQASVQYRPEEVILDSGEVKALLKISPTTLGRYRKRGLPHDKKGSKITYIKSEVLAWRKKTVI